MPGYYSEKLSAARLKRCYDLAPPRVKQYLRAEIDFAAGLIKQNHCILELGCGYGRVIDQIAAKAKNVFGIDTSLGSLIMAKEYLSHPDNCHLICSDAVSPSLMTGQFDLVLCLQNGISAFRVNPKNLIQNAYRLNKAGGKALFSTYSEKFWNDRLDWFQIQARYGLIGEIDKEATGEGVIICKDGFRADTVSPTQFKNLISTITQNFELIEIDKSSLFCILEKS
jgi:2-polyprenyl-6-hydroxyphenyl methylase/3-demethylubiquinone-9 3-methyltransferase